MNNASPWLNPVFKAFKLALVDAGPLWENPLRHILLKYNSGDEDNLMSPVVESWGMTIERPVSSKGQPVKTFIGFNSPFGKVISTVFDLRLDAYTTSFQRDKRLRLVSKPNVSDHAGTLGIFDTTRPAINPTESEAEESFGQKLKSLRESVQEEKNLARMEMATNSIAIVTLFLAVLSAAGLSASLLLKGLPERTEENVLPLPDPTELLTPDQPTQQAPGLDYLQS